MLEEAQNNLKLFFPHCRSSLHSRFIKFFEELTNNTLICINKETNKTNLIDKPHEGIENNLEDENSKENDQYKIIIPYLKNGNGKRTSIIIKGIPSSFGCQKLYHLIKQFYKNVNFFYIPGYVCIKKEYMYDFVNVVKVL